MKKYLVFVLVFILVFGFMEVGLVKESPKAYREINFLDTEKEVFEKIKNDNKIDSQMISFVNEVFDGSLKDALDDIEKELGDRFIDGKTEIADTEFKVFFDFYKNKLYMVSFMGPSYTADYFDTDLKEDQKMLARIMKDNYGEPSNINNVSFLDMEESYGLASHEWEKVGDNNNINIEIRLEAYEYQYGTSLVLMQAPLYREKNNIKKQKEEEEIEDSSSDF